MSGFTGLLRSNRNYRFTWSGQVVSEVGDHFNNIAVFSLALANTGSGLVVAGILIARGIPVLFAGPIAGVLLDRWDRKRTMIAADLLLWHNAIADVGAGLATVLANVQVVLIKPGWISTPMTAHLPQNFLFASAEQTGREVYKAMISPRAVVYCPWYWKWIMGFIRFIPEPIFARLNL